MAKSRKKTSNPKGVAPPLKGYYSNAVRVTAGPLLFIAGQLGVDKTGKLVGPGDVRAQATQVLENIRTILKSYKADMKDVLEVKVYVTDMKALAEIADIRLKYFPKDGPSSTLVEISRLAIPEAMIEIAAVAAVP